MATRTDNVQVKLEIDGQQARAEIDNLQRKADLLNQEMKGLKKGTEEYAAKQKDLAKVTSELEKQRSQLGLSGMSMQQLQRYAGNLAKEIRTLTPGTQQFIDKTKEFQAVQKRIADVNKEIKGIDDSLNPQGFLQKGFASLKNMLAGLGPAMLAAFSITAIIEFGKAIYNVTSEFQRMEKVLETTLGSKGLAKAAMADIKELAATTPMSVQEWTDSYIKLVNRGINPTREQLVKLGDTAASQGKSLDQYIEAFLDAQTGEFERLKEFGIKASKSGDQITFSFKNQQQVVKNNSEAITEYLYKIGEADGVLGGMAGQAEIAVGKVSNLGDAWDNMLNTLGSARTGLFAAVIDWLAGIVDMANRAFQSLDQIRETVGASILNDALKADMAEIEQVASSLTGKGMEAQRARIRAVELVRQSIADTLQTNQQLSDQEKQMAADRVKALENYLKTLTGQTKTESDAEKKAREKAAKDAEKARQEYEKDEAAHRKRLEDLQIAAIKDDEAREIAQAKVKARRESEEVQNSSGSATTKKQLVTAIEESLQSEVSKIQDKYREKRRKSDEDFARDYDERRRRTVAAEADFMLVQAQLVADQLAAKQKRSWFFTSKDRADFETAQQILLDAQINRLDTQKQLELENANLTNTERLLIEADYEAQKDELRRQYIDEQAEYEKAKRQAVMDATVSLTQGGLQAIADFTAIATQKEIASAENVKNRKVSALKFELNSKKLSQEEYQAALQVLEEQTDIKVRAIKKRQAATEKAVRIAESIMNTAVGVTAALRTPPPGNIPAAIVTGILGAVQTAKIAATPLQFAKGGAINPVAGVPDVGQLHSGGGIKMLDGATGQMLGEWERGEPYMILSRNTYANNRDIVDSLLHSSLHRNGARIGKRFADGGIAGADATSPTSPGSSSGAAAALDQTSMLISVVQETNTILRTMPAWVKAYVVLTDLQDAQSLDTEIDQASSFG